MFKVPICSDPHIPWYCHSVEVFYKMVVPGSTLAALSITHFTPHGFTHPLCCHCYPPPTTTASSSAADLSPCRHHPLPCPLAAAAVVCRCSTSPPIACHPPPPPSPNAAVCQPSSQPSSTVRCRHRPTQSSTARCTRIPRSVCTYIDVRTI